MGSRVTLTDVVRRWAVLVCAGLTLSGCALFNPASSLVPPVRPDDLTTGHAPVWSEQSQTLARLYLTQQDKQLAQGLLRRDGGGPDTRFTADDLARNFETLAFGDEFSGGFTRATRRTQGDGQLSRWTGPVRITPEFGTSISRAQRDKDRASVSAYATRLARITAHPITTTPVSGNFRVLIAGEDDRDFVLTRLKQLLPGISQSALDQVARLPSSTHCLVVAASDESLSGTYKAAVALIRAEHPDLVRLSCIHEEIAQGLGLRNDSPRARPSIFNDDDEFALLTAQDELLLKMLYDPRLKPGMTAAQARPVIRIIAQELIGVGL